MFASGVSLDETYGLIAVIEKAAMIYSQIGAGQPDQAGNHQSKSCRKLQNLSTRPRMKASWIDR
ncbi:hypothetical protein STRDD11_01085 [Streptococcus sp. DD11]|nr:hypothetical protein STRDD11_01085 [Streptococcus sp. DD11]